MRVRVYYEDVDVGGIVYHSKYINFCERARSEIFFAHDISPKLGSYHFVVKALEAKYHKPAFLGDILDIKTALSYYKGAVVRLHQSIFKEELLCFEMEITLVCLKNDRPARLPDPFLKVIRSFQSQNDQPLRDRWDNRSDGL